MGEGGEDWVFRQPCCIGRRSLCVNAQGWREPPLLFQTRFQTDLIFNNDGSADCFIHPRGNPCTNGTVSVVLSCVPQFHKLFEEYEDEHNHDADL